MISLLSILEFISENTSIVIQILGIVIQSSIVLYIANSVTKKHNNVQLIIKKYEIIKQLERESLDENAPIVKLNLFTKRFVENCLYKENVSDLDIENCIKTMEDIKKEMSPWILLMHEGNFLILEKYFNHLKSCRGFKNRKQSLEFILQQMEAILKISEQRMSEYVEEKMKNASEQLSEKST